MKRFLLEFLVGLAAAVGVTVLALMWTTVVFGLGVLLPLRDGEVVRGAVALFLGVGLGVASGNLVGRRIKAWLTGANENPGHQSSDEVT